MTIITELLHLIVHFGGKEEDFYYLATPEGHSTLEAIAKMIAEAGRRVRDTFRLTINHDRSVEDGIRDGHYDWVNPNITSSTFPSTKRGVEEVGVHLIRFNRRMDTKQVLAEVDRMGYKPADHQHALAFGEKYPDIQRQFPIAFLGSFWQDPGRWCRSCVCLGRDNVGRSLNLYWLVGDWGGSWRFAVLSK